MSEGKPNKKFNEDVLDENATIIVSTYEADGRTPREWCACFDANMNPCPKNKAKWVHIVTWIHGYSELIIGLVNRLKSENDHLQEKTEEGTGRTSNMILDAIEKEAIWMN